jgi:acetyl-CoA carboxylase biotin carboxylase subunit
VAAFGSGAVYLEKLLSPVRHIEKQVIADLHGNVVTLGERECSIQRRHQKMIEECPSPTVDPRLRDRLSWAAITAARVAGYENVGTVEFLLDADRRFYFLEMNTRLQVEHPVTEIVAGVDLVAEQIRVAAGHPLSHTQESVPRRGWAIECRIVAESPGDNFMPSIGEISFAREPAGPGIRVESALYDGFQVSVYYDALVAKVTAWGGDRDEATRRMLRALSEFKIVGVETNIPFHMQVLQSDAFRRGDLNTDFLATHMGQIAEPSEEEREAAMIAAALLTQARAGDPRVDPAGRDGASPWKAASRQPLNAGWGRAGWRTSSR